MVNKIIIKNPAVAQDFFYIRFYAKTNPMKKLFFIVSLTLVFNCNNTKNKTQKDVVTADELKNLVQFLASDDMKGRQTGSEEINLAAHFIENKLQSYGIKPYYKTYRDTFKIGDVNAFNVVGFLEGKDEKLKKDIIIIGAHYDHIGFGRKVNNDSIANGANDNASGTAAVLALAKYFAKQHKNKRSIMFALFSAEEMRLKGSKHLAKRLSTEQANVYAMVNLEMIGVPLIDTDYSAFLTGYEYSNMGEKINEVLGEKAIGASEISKKYKLFARSDNYPFFQEMNIPSHTISSCDLTNFDQYHKVGDEVELLDFDFMADLINRLTLAIEYICNSQTQEIQLYDKN